MLSIGVGRLRGCGLPATSEYGGDCGAVVGPLAWASGRLGPSSELLLIDGHACLIAQLCPALCNPVGYSPPGSSVCEIFQLRIQEWMAISSSRGSSQPRDRTPSFTSIACVSRWILYLLSHQGSSNREMAFCNSFLIPCVLTSLFINEEFKGSFRVLAFFTSRHKASWRPWSFFLMVVQCFLNTRFTIDGHLAVSVLCTYKQRCTFVRISLLELYAFTYRMPDGVAS